jgi:hypothetical protein
MPKGSDIVVLEDVLGAVLFAVLLLLLLLTVSLLRLLLPLLPPNMLIKSLVGDRGAAFKGAALAVAVEDAEDPPSRLNMSAPRVSPALPEGAGCDPSSGVLCIVLFFLSLLLRF